MPCRRCDVTVNNTGWTPVPDDQICDRTAQFDWENLRWQACTYNNVCRDSMCTGELYSCPPLQECEAPVDSFPHVCDMTGPGSTTGGCQAEPLPEGTVCAPQVHGCMLEATCNGVSGTCPPQVPLSGIIYQDQAKAVVPLLPDGSPVVVEAPTMPSLTTVSASYDSFRAECGELRLRQAIIPDGTCLDTRVSDRLGGFGIEFDAPPRGGFEIIATSNDEPIQLFHDDQLGRILANENGVGGNASLVPLTMDGNFASAIGSHARNGVAEPFLDVEVRREHAVNLRAAFLVDAHGAEVQFNFPSMNVAGEWLVLSGRGEHAPDAAFDWLNVVGVRLVRDGTIGLSVPFGTTLLSLRRLTLRTRALAPPCPYVEFIGATSVIHSASTVIVEDTTLFEAAIVATDVNLFYDTAQNRFKQNVFVETEVGLPAADVSVAEIQLITEGGPSIVAGVAQPIEPVLGADGLYWTRVIVPARPGTLSPDVTDTSFSAVSKLRVGVPTFHVSEYNVTNIALRRVYITRSLRCAHAMGARAEDLEVFVESTTSPAVHLAPVSIDASLLHDVTKAPSGDVFGPSFDLNLAPLFDAECQCFRHVSLDIEMTIPVHIGGLSRVSFLQLATGHGLHVDMSTASRLPSMMEPNSPNRRRLRVSLDGPGVAMVGPIENWENVDAVRFERTATLGMPTFVLHSIQAQKHDVPCVSGTALPLRGFVEPGGAVAADSVATHLAVADGSGRLARMRQGSTLSRHSGIWHDGGRDGDDEYSAATVLSNGRGESLVVALGHTAAASDPRFAGHAVTAGAGDVVAARHARTGAGAWALELGAGVTGYSVSGAVSTIIQSSRRLADVPSPTLSSAPLRRRLNGATCPPEYEPSLSDSELCVTLLTTRTWSHARRACKVATHGLGFLMHPRTSEDFGQVLGMAQNAATGRTPWVGLRRAHDKFTWNDGELEDPSNIDHVSGQGCWVATPDGLREVGCEEGHVGVCAMPSDRYDSCPPSWYALHGYCVHYEYDFKSRSDAHTVCKELLPGSTLVSVRNVEQDYGFWAYGAREYASMYHGLSDTRLEGSFIWEEGDLQTEYSHWYVQSSSVCLERFLLTRVLAGDVQELWRTQ